MKHFYAFLSLLFLSLRLLAQGTENFENIPTATANSYSIRNWTGDGGITWTATDARTDQTINTKAIAIRNGALTSGSIPNGIGSLAFKYKYLFTTGPAGNLVIKVNGTQIGTLTVPTTQTTPAVAVINSNINISGNFTLEITQTAVDARIAIDSLTWTAFSGGSTMPCTEPGLPTALTLTPSQTSVAGSFTAPSPVASNYLIVRSTNSTLSATPADGTSYSAGQALGGGTVVSHSTTTTFTDNGLTASTQYYYFVFAANNTACTGGPNYNAAPLSGNTTTSAPTPCTNPSAPTALNLTPAQTSIAGSFTGVSGASNYLVVQSTSATLTAQPVAGSTYTTGQNIGGGTVISYGTNTTFTATGLNSGTSYYYFVFAANTGCPGAPAYGPALTGNATTTQPAACTAPAAPTGFSASSTVSSVSGSFTGVTGVTQYMVVQSTSATLSVQPVPGTNYTVGQSIGGGTVISNGYGTAINASSLNSNTTYYYHIFAVNNATTCSNGPAYSTALTGNIQTSTAGSGIPAGYYSTATGLNCQPLKTALKNVIKNANVLSYTPGLWNLYYTSDKKRNDANTADVLWDIYSDNPNGPDPYNYTLGAGQCGNYNSEADCYNREHSMPQSWFGSSSPMVSDAHHIFPTDGYVNSKRGNYPYGKVTNATYTSLNGTKLGTGNNYGYTGIVFEPIDAYKGDVARATLYMAVRYEDEIIAQNWSANGTANDALLSATDQPNASLRRLKIFDDWYLQLLISWHNQDPVSQKEIDRNNAIYSTVVSNGSGSAAQGNRNPFVDHPEYVDMVFNCTAAPTVPSTFTAFSVTRVNNTTATIHWSVSNENTITDFEVQRSLDSVNFTTINTTAKTGTLNYSYTDAALPVANKVFYRVKMNTTSTPLYTEVKWVENMTSIPQPSVYQGYGIYPNPANQWAKIVLPRNVVLPATIHIRDMDGRLVSKLPVNTVNQPVIDFPVSQLASGIYNVTVDDATGRFSYRLQVVH